MLITYVSIMGPTIKILDCLWEGACLTVILITLEVKSCKRNLDKYILLYGA